MNEAPERVWADWSPADEDTMPATLGCYTPKCRDVARWKRVDYVRDDLVEALTAERDEAWAYMSALQGDLYDAIMIKAERDRLREALWAILACETPNANATVTRMVAIAKAALKGETP